MILPRLAIQNHQFTLIIVILVVLIGVVSFFTMPKSEDPLVQPPGVSIIVLYPGATPADNEELIVEPIEEAINELDDIEVMTSEASDGLSVIEVEFLPGSDSDEKYDLVTQKINRIRDELPADILDLELVQWSISDVHILQMALVSETASYRDLEDEADRLKTELEKTPGVKTISLWAIPPQQVHIAIDMATLASRSLPLTRVIGAIQDANVNIRGGHVDVGTRLLSIKTSGAYESVDAIANTVVHAGPTGTVLLKDIAEIKLSAATPDYKARFNGKRCVYITANQKERTNIFTIFNQLRPKIDAFKNSLPPKMSLYTAFDQSTSVSNRVEGFFMNLLQGIVLVGIVILIAIGARPALIVMMAIPISIMAAIASLDLSHYGLQQMSIAGLVIALGLLVDNAIVVTENTSRFIRTGLDREEAAIAGTSQIGWAVVSSTATTVLAFIPIIMIRDITGEFIRSMPVTVVYTLTASLLVSLTLTPYFATRVLRPDGDQRSNRFRRFLNQFIETHYRKRLLWAQQHPARTLIIALMVFVLALGCFPLVGISFFPKAEKPQFFININLPQGTNLRETTRMVDKVEHLLSDYPQIRNVVSNIGRSNPRLYYNIIAEREKSNHAQLFVELQRYDVDRQEQLIAELRNRFSHLSGVEIELKELEQGPPVEAPVAIRILGDNLDQLRALAGDVESMVRSTPGTINIHNPLRTTKSDLRLNINREKAAMLGVRLSDIDYTVRACINGVTVSQYRDPDGKARDIVVRLPIDENPSLTDLQQIYVYSQHGQMIPLSQLATTELSASPLYISHYDMERSVSITADVAGHKSVNELSGSLMSQLESYSWPKGYRFSMGGEMETRQESFGGMMQAILAALLAIFGVLVLQFRSYSQPLIVFSAIPLAVIGSILALLITGYTFSFSAFIGLTSLVGIVVNNSIILVDYTNQLLRSGIELTEAVRQSAETRFTPIILTTATTIGGLLPLTLAGGSVWAPMGWTIIGGLLMSTVLTLIIVPTLYTVITRRHTGTGPCTVLRG